MNVGDKVWVMLGGYWEKAVVVPWAAKAPAGNSVFVLVENDQKVYRFHKDWVKGRND